MSRHQLLQLGKRDVKASALGFCRKSGMCSSLLNWFSVLLGHIFNSLRLILWRLRCCWVHVWTDCTLTNCVWTQLQQENWAPKERIQRFTETLANRQAFKKHSCTRFVQGWQGFGTKTTTAQVDNLVRRGQQEKVQLCNQSEIALQESGKQRLKSWWGTEGCDDYRRKTKQKYQELRNQAEEWWKDSHGKEQSGK